jgi:hypothetical protein
MSNDNRSSAAVKKFLLGRGFPVDVVQGKRRFGSGPAAGQATTASAAGRTRIAAAQARLDLLQRKKGRSE